MNPIKQNSHFVDDKPRNLGEAIEKTSVQKKKLIRVY